MTRYIGHKPKNWAAAVLVFGWMGLALLGIAAWRMGWLEGLSLFRPDLSAVPLAWQNEMSFPGFVLVMSPLLLGGLACWLVPASGHSLIVSWTLVVTGGLAVMAGVAWDIRSGTALYADRIEERASGFTSRLEIHRFTDIVRVESSCVTTRRRRSTRRDPGPTYWLVFRDGSEVEAWRLAELDSRGGSGVTLRRLDLMNDAATSAEAVRAPRRGANGEALGSPGCLSMLADRMGVSVARLQPYFSVHQAELREGEYRIEPPDGNLQP